MVPWSWRHLPRAGVHETPDQQCIRRLSNDLYGGDGLGNGPAQRGRNWHFGLGWVCFCNLVRGIAGKTTHCTCIFGACASGGLSPQVPSFWGSNRYFPPGCGVACAFWCGPAATGAADFLDDSSSLQRRVRENINAPRSACLPSTWLVSICSYGRCAVADFCGPAVPSE
jgi:hypothetical protein